MAADHSLFVVGTDIHLSGTHSICNSEWPIKALRCRDNAITFFLFLMMPEVVAKPVFYATLLSADT